MSGNDDRGRSLAVWLLPQAKAALDASAGDPEAAAPAPVRVAWYDALDATRCPAAFRARLADEGPWGGWTPARAARSVAREALRAQLERDERERVAGSPPLPPPDPLSVVREHLREVRAQPVRNVHDWLADPETSDGERRLTAAGAARWIAGLLRAVGWPLPPRTSLDDARAWKHGGVTVAPSVDATFGPVTAAGRHTGAVLVASSGAGRTRLIERACVEAAAMTLGRGIAPAGVTLLLADTGENLHVAVDRAELVDGLGMIATAASEHRAAVERGYDEADAVPGAHCRFCEQRATCPPGQGWLRGPGRRHGGLPVLDPD